MIVPLTSGLRGLSIKVRGTVQGVGFRPFVYRLASEHGLTGWVRNTAGQVEIEVDGATRSLGAFLHSLRKEAPPLAHIDVVEACPRPAGGYVSFEILASELDGGWQAVSPDVATCDECLRELFDPADRRYHYPFINCTHCGPRFTIIEDLPYDRQRTTMQRFPMCEHCRREYEDPADRRFHAQPVACPACGPRLWLHLPGGAAPTGNPIRHAAALLRAGSIVALKGLGGFHLACDARSAHAVATLRTRKHRYGKPFAVMVPDAFQAGRIARVSPAEAEVLSSRERPVVLLGRPGEGLLADAVAPGLDTVGVMLPYTPLHHLLLREFGGPLVMTSGNRSEEPIACGNADALERLGPLADAFLLHDRDIAARYDDSVVRVISETALPLRRARGYAPAPVDLPFEADTDILAFGAQQKNAFCLVKGNKAFLSPHIGDLDNLDTLDHFHRTIELMRSLFRAEPHVLVHDLHPDYASTAAAQEYDAVHAFRVGVQHHHAHVVSCMVENGVEETVIGVAYDGTGYGDDGAIWGGEILLADWRHYQRVAHLRYVPLPGIEAAIRRPYRMGASHVWAAAAGNEAEFAEFLESIPEQERGILRHQVATGPNSPPTSSMGRLFDAVAALLGLAREASYEGQPAAELEAIAQHDAVRPYPFTLEARQPAWQIDTASTIRAVWRDLRGGVPVPTIAARFHSTVVAFTVEACRAARGMSGINKVCLSGGCFQNALLTSNLVGALTLAGFDPLVHRQVPPNDGGLALGQAVVAHALVTSSRR